MEIKILEFLKKTQYFSNSDISNLYIEKLYADSYRIELADEVYELNLYNIDYQIDIYNEINHKQLEELGSKPKHTYEIGFSKDFNQTYSIREYREEIDLYSYLASHGQSENYNLGRDFGFILKNLHNMDTDKNVDWYNVFNTKSNYLFYMHGVNEVGDTDYILIDYINGHKHLCKNLKTSYLYQNMDANHIFVTKNKFINLEGLGFNIIGDPAFDFTQVNRIALINSEFTKGLMDEYFDDKKIPIKFFRLLSLYQAYEILDSIVANRRGENPKLSRNEIENLLDMYDNFNHDIPDWI